MDAPARLTFDAARLARAWLSVAVAAADDRDRPALYRSTCVDVFAGGVRLAATDAYMVLAAWVPALEADDERPGLAEVAPARYVAVDVHHRARGLLAHLRKLATAKDADPIDVELVFDDAEADAEEREEAGHLAGMGATHIALEHPEHERVLLDLYEAEWPAWQQLLLGFQPGMTPAVALSPWIIGRLSSLGRWTAGPLRWEWAGDTNPARVAIGDDDDEIVGLVMPVRTSWGAGPTADPPEEDEALTAEEARRLAEDDAEAAR